MTVYRQFGGKERLLVAVLDRWSAEWLRRMGRCLDPAGTDPRSPLDGLWGALEEWFADDDFSGSLIHDAARELRDAPAHPAHLVIAAHHRATRTLLTDLAGFAGARDPHGLALQLELLIGGAVALAVRDRPAVVGALVRKLGDAAVAASRDRGADQEEEWGVVPLVRGGRTRPRGLQPEMPATPAG